jgi:hypothetical protein
MASRPSPPNPPPPPPLPSQCPPRLAGQTRRGLWGAKINDDDAERAARKALGWRLLEQALQRAVSKHQKPGRKRRETSEAMRAPSNLPGGPPAPRVVAGSSRRRLSCYGTAKLDRSTAPQLQKGCMKMDVRFFADVRGCTNFWWFGGVGPSNFFGFCVPRRRG